MELCVCVCHPASVLAWSSLLWASLFILCGFPSLSPAAGVFMEQHTHAHKHTSPSVKLVRDAQTKRVRCVSPPGKETALIYGELCHSP